MYNNTLCTCNEMTMIKVMVTCVASWKIIVCVIYIK